MRVAIISSEYPPYMYGGIGTQTYDLAHSLANNDVEVAVFCGKSKKLVVHEESENLTIYRLPIIDAPPRFVWLQLQNLNFFRQILQNYDVVHSQTENGTYCAYIKEKIGKPWVVSFHHHYYTQLKLFLRSDVRKWTVNDAFLYVFGYPIHHFLQIEELKHADHYIFCGFSAFHDYLDFNKLDIKRFSIIQNGIDLNRTYNQAKNATVQEDSSNFTIFSCGRLCALKGFDFLIKAMPHVLGENEDVKFKIFGKGPEELYLKTLIRKLGLTSNVTLRGYVPYGDLIRELHQSDLAVFPTLLEVGGSIAILEAMACRKPVVAFRYPFTEEVITHLRTGFLSPPMKIRELGSAISLLLSDKELRKRIGDNAFDYVCRRHDYSKLIKKYMKVYFALSER